VHGLRPVVEQVDQLCEACLAGKQRGNWFPELAQYRARRLVRPITPTTPSDSSYFLLLVDHRSRYTWVAALPSKDRAAEAIKEFRAREEGESGLGRSALIEAASSP